MSLESDIPTELGPAVRALGAGQTVFGRYELRRKLGEGGFGAVWLVYDLRLREEVALKFVLQAVAASPEAIDALMAEAARSRKLTHLNIVRIHDFVSDAIGDAPPDLAAISMEYVAGESLAERRLREPGKCFDVEQIAPWIDQLCQALTYAHDRKRRVIHRDLKPANLLLTHDGDLKVADFGIACSLVTSVRRVDTGVTGGTLPFMSPQQLAGGIPSESDDIYSLGATIYMLLTGTMPFRSGDIAEQVRNKVPEPLGERRQMLCQSPGGPALAARAPIPPAWEETVAACLAKDAAARPASADAVAQRLGLRPGFAPARFASPQEVIRVPVELIDEAQTSLAQRPAEEPKAAVPSSASSAAPLEEPSVQSALEPGRKRRKWLAALFVVLLLPLSYAVPWTKFAAANRAQPARPAAGPARLVPATPQLLIGTPAVAVKGPVAETPFAPNSVTPAPEAIHGKSPDVASLARKRYMIKAAVNNSAVAEFGRIFCVGPGGNLGPKPNDDHVIEAVDENGNSVGFLSGRNVIYGELSELCAVRAPREDDPSKPSRIPRKAILWTRPTSSVEAVPAKDTTGGKWPNEGPIPAVLAPGLPCSDIGNINSTLQRGDIRFVWKEVKMPDGEFWYLIGEEAQLTDPGRPSGLLGWVPSEAVLLWNTNQVIEPDWMTREIRERDGNGGAKIFATRSNALEAIGGGTVEKASVLAEEDIKAEQRQWPPERSRFPLLAAQPFGRTNDVLRVFWFGFKSGQAGGAGWTTLRNARLMVQWKLEVHVERQQLEAYRRFLDPFELIDTAREQLGTREIEDLIKSLERSFQNVAGHRDPTRRISDVMGEASGDLPVRSKLLGMTIPELLFYLVASDANTVHERKLELERLKLCARVLQAYAIDYEFTYRTEATGRTIDIITNPRDSLSYWTRRGNFQYSWVPEDVFP